jgi:hypothetical protein
MELAARARLALDPEIAAEAHGDLARDRHRRVRFGCFGD